MSRRAVFVAAGFLGVCFSLSAQQSERANSFSALNGRLHFPSLTLAGSGSFAFTSAFNQMETTSPDFLPASLSVATTTARRSTATSPTALAPDSSKEVAAVRRPVFDYAGGEIGFLYGRSTGKFARDFEQGYIVGGVGNEHIQISAGAAYEHSGGRDGRFGR